MELVESSPNGHGETAHIWLPAEVAKDTGILDAQQMMTRDGRVARSPHIDPLSEIGTTGLKQFGGWVLEEWLAQLQGKRGAWVWREMQDNSSVVGAFMFAVRMLARKVEWRLESGDDTPLPGQQMTSSEFVHSCMHDMSETWGDTVSEILSFLPYGWSLHEEVFKRRNGEQPERWTGAGETEEPRAPASSKYDDGLLGWRKLPVRAQETLLRWDFDGYSGLRGMEQVDWHGGQHTIPIAKSLLFRTEASRGNPEGRSILRSAYQAYYYMQTIQTLEAIGIARDLTGIPVATPPPGVDLFSPSRRKLYDEVKALVTGIAKDEQQGVVLPTAEWKLELLSVGGSRQVQTDPVLRRYRQEIAASVLSDFILVGLDDLGSYAMVDIKAELFGLAVDAVLDIICEIFNKYGVPRLFRLNGFPTHNLPRLTHSSTGRIDLQKVGEFLFHLAGAGAQIPWSEALIEQLFGEAGLPANFEGEETREVKKSARKPPHDDIEKSDDVVEVSPALTQRVPVLSMQLEKEIQSALKHLGEQAATSYASHAMKDEKPSASEIRALARKVMGSLDVKGWVQTRLMPLLRNHSARVAGDTQRVLTTEIGMEMRLAETQVADLEQQAGYKLRTRDIEPQVRDAIMRAIKEGVAAGDNPMRTAQRIRHMVPAGRFVNAGPQYRSRLIARQETLHQQRLATLAAYEQNPSIEEVVVRDGIFGPPRSDEACIARAGERIPVEEAAATARELHPQCTVSYDPVVAADAARLLPA